MESCDIGLRVLLVEDVDAPTWSASVIGLSTDTVSGTVLPFSTIGGNSSFTLPGSSGASPISSRIAAAIASSVAPAGGTNEATPMPAAADRTRRRVGDKSPSPPACGGRGRGPVR